MIDLISIIGPTASGKTKLATNLAHALDTSVISADSRQLYKGMDIGTGKDLKEYQEFTPAIKYHLIDILEAGERYNLFEYQKACFQIIQECNAKNKAPIFMWWNRDVLGFDFV